MSVNKVILVGRLGIDPEIKYTNSGKAICNFTLATTERWIDEDGNKSEKVTWHKVTCWNSLAQNCEKYLTKGREVYIEGKIQTRTYDNNDGVTIHVTEILALNVIFLGAVLREIEETDAA
jgi:single-strand DNA-binding protein